MKRQLQSPDGPLTLTLDSQPQAGNYLVMIGESTVLASAQWTPTGDLLLDQDGILRTVQVSRQGDLVWVSQLGTERPVLSQRGPTTRWREQLASKRGGAAQGTEVRSPMTGRVVILHVQVGDIVTKSQPLVVVEAMKMEHSLKAPRAGVVRAIHCQPGQLVDGGVELIELADE